MLEKFLALSRTAHGVLDIALPGFAALLWLGHFPSFGVLIVALITVFAGYTSLYAINDLAGVKGDKAKFANGSSTNEGYSVEGSALRYPIAQGHLTWTQGLYWAAGWFVVALIGAYWLNPMLLWIVLLAPVLELIYCKLLTVTHWRIVVSALVKSLGPVAAVLAVVPDPSILSLIFLVLWVGAWEVCGQNIPADWNDVEEDRQVKARTIPLVFGPQVAGKAVFAFSIITVFLSLFLPLVSPLDFGFLGVIALLAIGIGLLVVPAKQLMESKNSQSAAKLFDRASFYPLAMLLFVVCQIWFGIF